MKRKHETCASMDELIQRSLDGALDVEKRLRLERHLASCGPCARKLERLRAIEKDARSIKLDEPPPGYWNTLSRRVMERIESGGEGRPAWSARGLSRLFGFPRLRLAAGIVSVAVVVLAGALFLRHRGAPVPSVPLRGPVVAAPETVLTSKVSAESTGERKIEKTAEPSPAPGSEKRFPRQEEARPATQRQETVASTTSSGEPSIATETASAPAETSAAMGAQPAVASALTPSTASAGEVPRTDTAHLAQPPSAGEKSKELAAVVESTRAAAARSTGLQATAPAAKALARDAMVSNRSGAERPLAGESFTLDGMKVPAVSETDTSMSEGVVRSVIHRWRSHIERDPFDPLNRQGYVQVANAYYLLARLTRDETVISEGASLVRQYADRVDDRAIRALLLDSKTRIEGFRAR